ncbi:hypothetical protein CO038_01510 [Candidatus Pacearchaeota archaeon CG_4_9_14_0_2_um_filter_39_13]|nr:hypothetical protein [Candidatus Pacearchaeota archaeon]OIO43791.1 MAG: hypothetical protein AUJ64_01765 [Candidatus Pacearchaeota archaeon CG1_02_39_14]PJC44886.1 MAG: hypothetical protein CO038_01510 [Candidatus Pacearchaeota archaeon CG_4_9_14_0_2_um_filter_39_13]
MAWPWKKKGEVVDLTKMRHLLPKNTEEVEIVDLSSKKEVKESADSGLSALSALGGRANVKTNYSGLDSPGPITSGLRDARDARKEKLKAVFNEMRLKIEDNEYKMRDVVGKMGEMEKRIKELERRRY